MPLDLKASAMDIEIQTLSKEKIPELCDFLIAGFHQPPDAEFAAESVLEWKYFDSLGITAQPRSFVGTLNGRIVACIGVCPTWFVIGYPRQLISASHGIDWLATKSEVSAGLMVYQRSEEDSDVQFAIGGTQQAIAIKKKLGYKFPMQAPTFCRILRPTSRLRRPREDALWKAAIKVTRDYSRRLLYFRRSPKTHLELRQVSAFGDEIARITNACKMPDVHTLRTTELLNHYLRYPKKNISGWLLMEDNRMRGFALLSVVQHQGIRMGRIADCFMDCLDHDLWHSAIYSLTNQLNVDKADMVVCYGTTQWMAAALKNGGFYRQKLSPLSLRDPKNLVPSNASFYLTHLEADHAYL